MARESCYWNLQVAHTVKQGANYVVPEPVREFSLFHARLTSASPAMIGVTESVEKFSIHRRYPLCYIQDPLLWFLVPFANLWME